MTYYGKTDYAKRFAIQKLKIRLADYIVPPANILPPHNPQYIAWNKLILRYNATIVEASINIDESFYGCLVQMLDCLLNNVIEWYTCKENLDYTVI